MAKIVEMDKIVTLEKQLVENNVQLPPFDIDFRRLMRSDQLPYDKFREIHFWLWIF
jgi:hypothetical protein